MFLLCNRESVLWESFESKQPASSNSILLRHNVVQDRVDGSTKVEEDKGYQVAVLADHSYLQGSGFKGFGKQISSYMKRQPAEYESKHHHS